jgi:hypothetical protein
MDEVRHQIGVWDFLVCGIKDPLCIDAKVYRGVHTLPPFEFEHVIRPTQVVLAQIKLLISIL